MKTIFIPTDFSLAALECIPDLCDQFKNETLSFIFVHAFKLSDSITELLMLSRRSKEYAYISDEFYQQCNQIRGEYKQIHSIRTEFFFGSTMAMFRNFLESNGVTTILHPQECSFTRLNQSSLDPFTFTAKSGLPVVSVIKVKKPVYKPVSVVRESFEMVAEA